MLRRHERISHAGSLHFVTTVTSERGKWFVRPSDCRGMLAVFEQARARLGVICLGYVLMPDHFHALVEQTAEGNQVSELMRYFKRQTSQKFRPEFFAADTLWSRRFDDVPVPGDQAAHAKLNYIHANPVKKGLCDVPESYPWSSARAYSDIEDGIVNIERDRIGFQWL